MIIFFQFVCFRKWSRTRDPPGCFRNIECALGKSRLTAGFCDLGTCSGENWLDNQYLKKWPEPFLQYSIRSSKLQNEASGKPANFSRHMLSTLQIHFLPHTTSIFSTQPLMLTIFALRAKAYTYRQNILSWTCFIRFNWTWSRNRHERGAFIKLFRIFPRTSSPAVRLHLPSRFCTLPQRKTLLLYRTLRSTAGTSANQSTVPHTGRYSK